MTGKSVSLSQTKSPSVEACRIKNATNVIFALNFCVTCLKNILNRQLAHKKVSNSFEEKRIGGELIMKKAPAKKKKATKKKK